ncbi:hypothetical protein KI387_007221, partial [Taxus chinensis]
IENLVKAVNLELGVLKGLFNENKKMKQEIIDLQRWKGKEKMEGLGREEERWDLLQEVWQLKEELAKSIVVPGYAIGCVEGRIALELIDLSKTAQANKYAFRCHPKSKEGRYYLIAVNAIEFHPTDGRFVTGNNEGYCILWDRKRKIRLHEYARYPASIASLSYNRDGQLLAVAASYNYREHDKG